LVLRWSVIVDQAAVQNITGKVSDEFLAQVLSRISQLRH
jgi:hypothetical protein